MQYKVGDICVITNIVSDHRYRYGDIVVIEVMIDGGDYDYFTKSMNGDIGWYVRDGDLELAPFYEELCELYQGEEL